jgi:hypothetical protein
MPNKDLTFSPGQDISETMRRFVADCFDNETLERVTSAGCRLRVSLSTPWPKKPKPKRPKVEITDNLLRQIKESAASPASLEAELSKFNGPQLIQIGKRLDVSLSKSSRVESLRAQLANSLRSGAIWQGITGQKSDGHPSLPSPETVESHP